MATGLAKDTLKKVANTVVSPIEDAIRINIIHPCIIPD